MIIDYTQSRNALTVALLIIMLFVSFAGLVGGPLALLLGVVASFTLGNSNPEFYSKISKYLLQVSVVGMGFSMNLKAAIATGIHGFWITLAFISFTLVVGSIMGRLIKMDKITALLISSGTAICGGSAIAAVAPAVKADSDQTSFAMGTVFLLNSVALLIFPMLGHWFGLSQNQFGLWSAIAIHDTSSVVGAASAYGSHALQVATTVKLTRALWIMPVSFVAGYIFSGDKKKPSIPWFIFLFVVTMAIAAILPSYASTWHTLGDISKQLLVFVLFLIGFGLSPQSLKNAGAKPLILGVSLWLLVATLAFMTVVLN